uniref:Intramembrane protease 2 n=2 Tax=Ascaris TaxID=6251 RepID=F1L680_ASCSU
MSEATTIAPPVFGDVPVPNNASNVTFAIYEQATAYGSLYGMALLCIVLGSIRSLHFVQRQIQKKKLIEASITIKEAKKFPITASCVLFGLYIFFKCDAECRQKVLQFLSGYMPSKLMIRLEKIFSLANSTELSPIVHNDTATFTLSKAFAYCNKTNIMYLLLLLICFEGCVALATLLKPIFSFVLRRLPIGERQPRVNYPYLWSLKKGKKEMDEGTIEDASNDDTEYLIKVEWDTHDFVAVLVCLSVGVSHLMRRHWISNDILGVAFSIYGIEFLHLASFKAGTMLLAGLFIYDVFWVFATDVMTTVAKGIDAPILLQFPQDVYRAGWLESNKYAMLGLGDIVIPGIFIALLRRFDYRIGGKGTSTVGRYYFVITVAAYALGLSVTMIIMHLFKAAQPALLYLVPACVLIPLSVAKIRGEAAEMWNYCEEHLIEKKDEDKLKEKEKEKKNK